VLSALPIAYWVNGDTGQKQTTEVNWDNKFLDIEEIAVIVPIPDSVVDDADADLGAGPAAARDGGRPPVRRDGAVRRERAGVVPDERRRRGRRGRQHRRDRHQRRRPRRHRGDHSDMLSAIEDDGYDPTGGIAARKLRGKARQARNTLGDRYAEVTVDRESVTIDGVRYEFPMRGLWPTGAGAVQAIAIDGSEFVVGVRQDVTWKFADEAVIQDNTGRDRLQPVPAGHEGASPDVACRLAGRQHDQLRRADEADRYPAAILHNA
jgi:hypothetical protein